MRYLKDLARKNLKKKTAILRLDFNTEDNWRMVASVPTVNFLRRKCRAVVILSHWGRPAGFEASLCLKKKAQSLSKLIKKTVVFVPHFRFKEIQKWIDASPAGSVFLLENLRFLKGESENSDQLASQLATLGDFYVNDAFAVSHRTAASVVSLPKLLPRYAGFELEAELKSLGRVMKNPKRPLVVVLGGLKIEDKLDLARNLEKKASAFLIGGALTLSILKDNIRKAVWPVDFRKENGTIKDIGDKTEKLFSGKIKEAKTIIWNGPVGDIGRKEFRSGTQAIARAIAKNNAAFTVVGGGETVMFLKNLKLDKKIDFISTGGGAMLDFLAGKALPGIRALNKYD